MVSLRLIVAPEFLFLLMKSSHPAPGYPCFANYSRIYFPFQLQTLNVDERSVKRNGLCRSLPSRVWTIAQLCRFRVVLKDVRFGLKIGYIATKWDQARSFKMSFLYIMAHRAKLKKSPRLKFVPFGAYLA